MKKRSLLIFVLVAALSAVLSGCGKNYYYANRSLPASGLTNRVMIAVQNPSVLTSGALQFVDGYYDIRHSYDSKTASFSIAGYSGKPFSIQNMPEEQLGAVYNSDSGSFTLVDYAGEKVSSTVTASGSSAQIGGLSSSIFVSRNTRYVLAANQQTHVLTVVDRSTSTSYFLNLPGVYRVSMNAGGTVALAFLQNSDKAYYVRRLQSGEAAPITVGKDSNADGDCQPQNNPVFCVLPVKDSAGNVVQFDRPSKALFAPDGTYAYVLNCGPECGSTTTRASVQVLPVAPLIMESGQQSGSIPITQTVIPVPGGASNGVFNGSTLYVAGQINKSITTSDGATPSDTYWRGVLSVIDTNSKLVTASHLISDGTPGKMILADDNALFIGTTNCNAGGRYYTGQVYGCLTMYNTSTGKATVDAYKGDLTGIAAITNLHKIYVAEGGQIHIYRTTDFAELDNYNVTVTGTAWDVAYMDGISDTNNTTY